MEFKIFLFTFILGILLGGLCKYYSPKLYKAPNSSKIQKIKLYDDKKKAWYSFRPVPYVCPPSIDIQKLIH